jgi:hypothetical protein
MKYSNRCDKHKIFIGKDGCKICNEIKQIEQVSDERYDYYVSECLINVKLKKENKNLKSDIEILRLNSDGKDNYIKMLQDEIEWLKSPIPNVEIKESLKSLTRNEKQIMINLLGSQSMLAVLVDHFNKVPEARKANLKPLYDYVINICEKVDYLNADIAEHMAKQLDKKEFENIISDVSSVCNFMAGKITKCKTCTAWLDDKAKNRKLV